ncbi:DUF2213 domain-containing protein [Bordetella avium]|uniref:DUF2213 domain-containing protein n=1 Tax=Bordetella avium TaxID=521 RepID=UPI000E6A2D63|nr:DUF2213 domain-containing protein [Bordetella avium]RIQ76130.1 DUF2213 domain-containing protein [Bordetella avium]
MSNRQTDINGFLLVRDNPITKVGVFPYLGREIGASDPDRIYQVYRPQEELEKPETIASANLVPWIDEHEFLGKDGTPAEKKGVQGTTGETARFEYPYLRNSIKVYSEFMKDLIDRGKVELSPSYRCRYEFTEGTFDGKRYHAIQRDLRFNHLATVKEGRTGPDLAVQDCLTITYDSAEFINMELTPENIQQIRELIVQALAEKAPAGSDDDPEADPTKKPEYETPDAVTPEAQSAAEQTAASAEQATQAVAAAQEAVTEAQAAVEEVQAAAEEVQAAPTADSIAKLRSAQARLAGIQTKHAKAAADAATAVIKRAQAKPAAPVTSADAIVKQIAERDKLAQRVTPHIGVFDHSSMASAQEVATYAAKKLGLSVTSDSALHVLNGYLQGAKPDSEKRVSDSKTGSATNTAAKLWGSE